MKTLGYIIWVLFGGFIIAVEYVLGSVALMVTIIGIPFGLQSLKLAEVALWPFGKKVIHNQSSSGCLSFLMNVIWFFVGGLPIVLTHLLFGLLFYITIMKLAFTPFGKVVVS